jgi:hypothetical protein
MTWMQKHRRFMMFFIFLFVGIPLAFFIPGLGGGNSGDGSSIGGTTAVVEVGRQKITATEFMREYGRFMDIRRRQNLPTDPMELLADGTIDIIVDTLIQRALVTGRAQNNPVRPERDYLLERLQDEPMFKNDQGEFVGSLYNQWVEDRARRGMNWDAFYAEYSRDVTQRAFADLVLSSAHVFESEMYDAFVRSRRTMKVKYVSIEPEIDESEEKLKAHHEANRANFMSLERRTAQYVAFSIQAPIPETATNAVERARAGEPFTDLVDAFSVGPDKLDGGDMGWIKVTETPTEEQEVIFALKAGDISDPFRLGREVNIYTVEEERINPDDESMEVHVRRIMFRPRLTPEERTAIEDEAKAFLDTVVDNDFETAALAAGLTIQTSGLFDIRSAEIDTVDSSDAAGFRQGFNAVEANIMAPNVGRGGSNMFVGKVISIESPSEQTYEEAEDDVLRNFINEEKVSQEYLNQVSKWVNTIATEAESLADITELVPDLNAEIKETTEFGIRDFLFSEGLFWDNQQVFAMFESSKPGDMKGPLVDFQRVNYFLELVEMKDADPAEVDPEWEIRKEEVLISRKEQIQSAREQDYLRFLSERAKSGGQVLRHDDVIMELIGFSVDEQPTAPQDTPGDVSEAPETVPADAESSDTEAVSTESDN